MSPQIAVPDEILTRRLRLRRHHEGDIEAFQGFMTDPRATKYMPLGEEQKTAPGARAMLLEVAELYDTEAPVFSLTITTLDNDRYIGSCGLSPAAEGGAIEIYFTLVEAAQGRGYATEAVEGLIDHCRANGTKRLIARVFDGNRASVGVLQRAGFDLLEGGHDAELDSAAVYALNL